MKIPEILLVETVHKPGALASVLQVIADEQLVIEHLQSLRRDQGRRSGRSRSSSTRPQTRSLYARIDELPNARFAGKSDRVFNRHRGGKIRMQASLPITTKQILRDIYTPGVARVCLAIRDDPGKVNLYTNRPNTVAVVTNGTAVLGLGEIGPVAGLPVMEGKAALFAALVGITAVPILDRDARQRAGHRYGRGDRAIVRRHPARGHRRAGLVSSSSRRSSSDCRFRSCTTISTARRSSRSRRC